MVYSFKPNRRDCPHFLPCNQGIHEFKRWHEGGESQKKTLHKFRVCAWGGGEMVYLKWKFKACINCPRFNDPTMDIGLIKFLHPLELHTNDFVVGQSLYQLFCGASHHPGSLLRSPATSSSLQSGNDQQICNHKHYKGRAFFLFFTHAKFWCGHVLKDDTSRAWFSSLKVYTQDCCTAVNCYILCS